MPASDFTSRDGTRFVVRGLKKSDLEEAVRFANRLVVEKRKNRDLGLLSFDRRVTREAERKWLSGLVEGVRRGETVSVAAFVRGELVGHCDIRRRKASEERHAGVLGVAVLGGHRGVGIGGTLVAEALDRARRGGLGLVELQVFATNEAAIRLYERMGFEKAGVIPNKILRDGRYFDEVTMFKRFRGSDKSRMAGHITS